MKQKAPIILPMENTKARIVEVSMLSPKISYLILVFAVTYTIKQTAPNPLIFLLQTEY